MAWREGGRRRLIHDNENYENDNNDDENDNDNDDNKRASNGRIWREELRS